MLSEKASAKEYKLHDCICMLYKSMQNLALH